MHVLTLLAWCSLGVAFLCALIIALDELRHPQQMAIMNIVWPVTALYLSVFAMWGYFRVGRSMSKHVMANMNKGEQQQKKEQADTHPSLRQVAISGSHCGAGCTLGDIVAEFGVYSLGITLFGSMLFTDYAFDYALAWLFGIAFQYFSIKPMQHLSSGQALRAAIKADTLSITAFQIGMYAWMALVYFVLFAKPHLRPTEALYWFMMQIAMICGYFTTLPANYRLVRKGVKETMS